MTSPLKVYLAGPMRGHPEYNFPLFLKAATDLRLAGMEVFNPAEQDMDRGFAYKGTTGFENLASIGLDLREAMADDMAYVSGVADAIVTLPGWESSPGASAEVALGLALGLIVFEYDSVMLAYARLVEKATRPKRPGYFYNDPDDAPTFMEDEAAGPYVPETSGKTVTDYVLGDPPADYEPPAEDTATPFRLFQREDDWLEPESPEDVDLLMGVNYDTEQIMDGSGNVVKEVRVISSTGGAKGSKPQRFDLIPVDPMWKIAEVYGRGAEKYEDRNWQRGYNWSLSYAALQRHLHQFWGGEYLDEDGLPHLAHAAFHVLALLWFAENMPEFDDRFGKSQMDLVAEEVAHLDRVQRERAGIEAGYLRLARDLSQEPDDAA